MNTKSFRKKRNGVLLEWSPIRNEGEGVSHHVTIGTPAERKPKFRSAIRQAVEVVKNEFPTIGDDLLRGRNVTPAKTMLMTVQCKRSWKSSVQHFVMSLYRLLQICYTKTNI